VSQLVCVAALAAQLGCQATTASALKDPQLQLAPRHRALSEALQSLAPEVEAADAEAMALRAYAESERLRMQYRLTRPPLFHNVLVNTRLRERGLCCHFVEDLARELRSVGAESLELHWAVAHLGNPFREHSSVLVVSAGTPASRALERGLVLDAWRNSGQLYWTRASEDSYPWTLHPNDGHWDRLHCSE